METLIAFGFLVLLCAFFAVFSLGYIVGTRDAENKFSDTLRDVDIKLSQLVSHDKDFPK